MTKSFLPTTIPGPPWAIAPVRVLRGLRFLGDSFRTADKLFRQYGSFTTLSRGGGTNIHSPLPHCPGTVVTCEPSVLKQLLTDSDLFHRYPLLATLYRYRNLSPRHKVLGNYTTGLFNLNGQSHQQAKQQLSPAFTQQAIAAGRDEFVAITERELDRWSLGEVYDLGSLIYRWSGKTITQALLGIEMTDAEVQFFDDTLHKLVSPLAISYLVFPYAFPGSPFRRFLRDLDTGCEIARNVIERSQAQCEAGDPKDNVRRTVLSLMLNAEKEQSALTFDEEQILNHLIALWTAGSETMGVALVWILFLLSQHPSITAELCDELTAKLHGDAPTVEQLQDLPLLDQVVKEGLRLCPAVPWNGRVMSRGAEVFGYDLPAGTEVMISHYHIHRNPDFYDKPHVFQPERWAQIKPKFWEYAPFGSGTRSCIGRGLTLLNLKVAIAMIIQRFRLEYIPTGDITPGGIFSLGSGNPISVKIHPQDRQFKQGVGKVEGFIRQMIEFPD